MWSKEPQTSEEASHSYIGGNFLLTRNGKGKEDEGFGSALALLSREQESLSGCLAEGVGELWAQWQEIRLERVWGGRVLL